MRQTGLRVETRRSRAGFTLIELMVTIFVAAILLAIAVPSFKHAISSTHTKGASNDLLADLKYARAEAVSRGNEVAVDASTSGNWVDGWRVVASAATTGGASVVLRRHAALKQNYQLVLDAVSASGVVQIAFSPRGVLAVPGDGACFTLSVAEDNHELPRRIVLRPSGAISQFQGNHISQTPCK